MSQFKSILILPIVLLLVLVACGGDEEATESPTSIPQPISTLPRALPTFRGTDSDRPTLTPTRRASSTPAPTIDPSMTFAPSDLTESDNPAIELITAPIDTCVNEDETQSTVLGFGVIYYRVATSNYVSGILQAVDGDYTFEFGVAGEGRDGAEGFGFYPTAYDLAPNTNLRLTLTVYKGDSTESEISSTSSLTYNCTTGEIIDKTFERQ